jgi:hypothetical protein
MQPISSQHVSLSALIVGSGLSMLKEGKAVDSRLRSGSMKVIASKIVVCLALVATVPVAGLAQMASCRAQLGHAEDPCLLRELPTR